MKTRKQSVKKNINIIEIITIFKLYLKCNFHNNNKNNEQGFPRPCRI